MEKCDDDQVYARNILKSDIKRELTISEDEGHQILKNQ